MSLSLADGCVGIIHYTLKNDAGEVLDSSAGGDPLPYLHGHHNIVPGLENALLGKTTGDTFEVAVPPAEGYGDKTGDGPQRVRRSEFPKDFPIEEGQPVPVQTADGDHLTLWITDVKGAWVWVDMNHPLAGETLHFDVEVVSVREAIAVELEHGHAHGLDGTAHHHGH